MATPSDRPLWARDGADWPHREASRFVAASNLTWHVQTFGRAGAPALLLLHGTGAATHSWRGLAPLLAEHVFVVAPDLPGHGFSDPLPPARLSLPGMAAAIGDLLDHLEIAPEIAVGHSAGAALLARLCLDGRISPRHLVALNGALTPFPGLAAVLFPSLARMLFLNRVTPKIFAWTADRPAVERLIRGTGSRLDAEGLDLYRRLFRCPGHVAGALGMMANWDLAALDRALPRLTVPTTLVVGGNDRAIAPETAFALQNRLPRARVDLLRNLGHLAHEEAPGAVAEIIRRLVPPPVET
ncbi:alpha/beta fold hydrolase BchO [Methylobacterium gossipiicola]|uniref:Magnesium chelatase accessory protein n=1 Tax=Methylobacterium gossipiicola TaxID=582675 RepID=A0A1I2VA44_9HYPH|nr:alpha/beta fold hydrolase BchO [Methylobacterium gossipiicola]SFG84286.1 magnesium chelatase accessory protein [Methylobacterium gossipiicola]